MLDPHHGVRAKYWPQLELNLQKTPCQPRVAPQVVVAYFVNKWKGCFAYHHVRESVEDQLSMLLVNVGKSKYLRRDYIELSVVIMSSSRRSGKEIATSGQKKRPKSENVPLAPPAPKGQTRRFRLKGQSSMRVPTDFKAPEARSHFVMVCGKNVPITPTSINDILGTPQDTDPLVLTRLSIRPPYQAICHMLCGLQSMVHWTKHSGKRYHKPLPYAHMLREIHVWLKVVMNCLIPGPILH
ncbi:hypothetical protein H5410_005319 [Solanum commersonii]|uniref:Uncharacterized protein n=1 Tax=Solanum commersonii TaxID=4109 RepID=A0A9J6A6B1_SOLCO|nr:hypothetical protein H5410_005319 [Solanum commersonii]